MIPCAFSAVHPFASMMARTAPCSQKLFRPEKAALLSRRVLNGSNCSSGGANKLGCPASITRSSVDPERGGHNMNMADGLVARLAAWLSSRGPDRGSNCLNCATWAALILALLRASLRMLSDPHIRATASDSAFPDIRQGGQP